MRKYEGATPNSTKPHLVSTDCDRAAWSSVPACSPPLRGGADAVSHWRRRADLRRRDARGLSARLLSAWLLSTGLLGTRLLRIRRLDATLLRCPHAADEHRQQRPHHEGAAERAQRDEQRQPQV